MVKLCTSAFEAAWERGVDMMTIAPPERPRPPRRAALPTTSPSSSVQAARQAIADRLREIRVDAGLTAKALAAAAEWDRTKISKIEHAARPPSADDIRRWCAVCKADERGHRPRGLAADGRGCLRRVAPPPAHRPAPAPGVARAAVTSDPQLPGLLLAGRARPLPDPLLRRCAAVRHHDPPRHPQRRGGGGGRPDGPLARRRRDGDHRFAVLVEEAVLRYQVGGPDTMAGQLHHLLETMALPSVSLGVIPFEHGGRRMWTLEGFNIFDSERVSVELLSAAVTVTTPGEVELYTKAFSELTAMAVFGTEARALISAAIDALD